MLGCFGDVVFGVNDKRVLTFANLKGDAGSDWATHDTAKGKARSEYMGPALKSYSFDVTLSALHGVRPRESLTKLQNMAEGNNVEYLIIGNAPVGENPFKLTKISESWGAVLNDGALIECKVSLTLEEYA